MALSFTSAFDASNLDADPEVGSERVFHSRLRRNDPAAFEQLVKEHQERVFNFCARMLGDREEANDLVQDIFLAVHQGLSGFRLDAKLSTWILRVAHNHCLNRLKYLRRRGNGRSDLWDELPDAALHKLEQAPPSPDDLLAARSEQRRVQRAIAQLDDQARLMVVLRDIEGLSYEEIVAITGVAEGTVKSRLHRAREKLSLLLAEPEPQK